MAGEDLKERTREFSLCVIRLVESLPKSKTSDVLGRQLLRSGTSVGANYRSACRSRSTLDFISRITIAEEEADESRYWMELMVGAKLVQESRLAGLMTEAQELVAIFAASARTAKKNKSVP